MEIMFCQIIKHIILFMVALLVLQSETGIQFLFGNSDFFRGRVFRYYSFVSITYFTHFSETQKSLVQFFCLR